LANTDIESRALKVIIEEKQEGILQSELWRKLNGNSREGSRIALKLEEKKLITRKRELHNGRWTYRIFIKHKPIDLETIVDIPCIFCEKNYQCNLRGNISPKECAILDDWLFSINK